MIKIGMIGYGNMGEAILSRCRGRFAFHVVEKCPQRQKHLHRVHKIKAKELASLLKECSVLLLAIKPQDFPELLLNLKGLVDRRHAIISIAAGMPTSYIENKIGNRARVVRAMPNLPAVVGRSVTAIAKGRYATDRDMRVARSLFAHIGKTVAVKEDLMNAVTATSGSGPGYVYFLMEQMIVAAQKIGLSEPMAAELVIETFSGSVQLLKTKNETPHALREKVTSKGGTTQAALEVFDKKKTSEIFQKALQAAVKRAKQLSRR